MRREGRRREEREGRRGKRNDALCTENFSECLTKMIFIFPKMVSLRAFREM